MLQAATERWLLDLGWEVGLSPAGTAVLADLIAERDGRWVAVEVKTLDEGRPDLARQQLRLGLGRVLDYRERLRQSNPDTHAIVVVSIAPGDPLWMAITDACSVGLAWPPFDTVPSAAGRAEPREVSSQTG